MYDNRLDFIANNHTICLRPKEFRANHWAMGLFRMIVQDVEDIIKDFNEEWKKSLEDAIAGNIPTETALINPSDKWKGKVGSKRKDPVEVPPEAQKKKDAEEVPPPAPKKKKSKATNPTLETALIDDDYDQIVAKLKEEMKDSF